jgi:YesN/AraC family two-component response regulator
MTEPAPIRVVVADDVADLRELVRIKLELEPGFTVVGEAENGAQAIEVAATTQPDCILLDLAMPVMDGLQAIPKLRQVAPRTKIAVLSGFDNGSMAATALQLGAHLYLDKGTALLELPTPLLQLIHPDHTKVAREPRA